VPRIGKTLPEISECRPVSGVELARHVIREPSPPCDSFDARIEGLALLTHRAQADTEVT
jgi:hypothetical protein